MFIAVNLFARWCVSSGVGHDPFARKHAIRLTSSVNSGKLEREYGPRADLDSGISFLLFGSHKRSRATKGPHMRRYPNNVVNTFARSFVTRMIGNVAVSVAIHVTDVLRHALGRLMWLAGSAPAGLQPRHDWLRLQPALVPQASKLLGQGTQATELAGGHRPGQSGSGIAGKRF
jgi:hypothetical protein